MRKVIKFRKPSAKTELDRIYALMAEMDPLSEDYDALVRRAEQLEKARSHNASSRLSAGQVLGNIAVVGTSVLSYWHEDILGKIPTRGLARSFIPRITIKDPK